MSDTTWTTADGCVTLTVPSAWEAHRDVRGIPLTALEPGPGFRTNAVVTYSTLPPGTGLVDWQRGTDQLLPSTLDDFLLIDLDRLPVAGSEGAWRLAHHAGPGGESLTMAQWCALVGSTGIALTLTGETLRYPELAPLMSRIAGSLQIHGEPPDPAPGAGEGAGQ